MSEPIRNKKMDSITAPTPQNTPANAAPISSRAQQPGVASIQEEDMERAAASLFASNPALVQMMQAKLGSLVGRSSGYIESLPASVRRRVDALKDLQKLHSDLEAKFQQEVLDLEKSYFYGVPPPKKPEQPKEEPKPAEGQKKEEQLPELKCFKDLYERRALIVNGKIEPTKAEIINGKEEKEEGEEDVKQEEEEEETKGIPEFWLSAMKNQISLGELITDKDEAVLKYLKDIRMEYLDEPGFRLLFEFEKNEYMHENTWVPEAVEKAKQKAREEANAARAKNSKAPLDEPVDDKPEPLIPWTLTKTYYYRSDPGYFGDFIYDSAHATKIEWASTAKNPTVRIESKKQRNRTTNQTRVVEKSIPTQSFFNFFDPPDAPEEDDNAGSEIEERLEFDYQLGEDIKEKLIPRAIDWFTGEALRYEELDDFDEGEFEDEDDEEDDDLSDDRDDDDETDDEADGGKPKQEAAECKQS